jgi:hypothetical protein
MSGMLLILKVAMLHLRVQTAESGFERFLSLAALSGLSPRHPSHSYFRRGHVTRHFLSGLCSSSDLTAAGPVTNRENERSKKQRRNVEEPSWKAVH